MSDFDTPFGMLHTLTSLESECGRVVNTVRHAITSVASGLDAGQLSPERASQLLRQADEELSKLAR